MDSMTEDEIEQVFNSLGLATDEERDALRFDALQQQSQAEITINLTDRTEALGSAGPNVDA
jgi:hypothetical protein